MAVFFAASDWHEGEAEMQRKLQVHGLDNPTIPQLSPQLANHLQVAPLISLGTVDSHGNPWTTLLGGEAPLSQPLGNGIIGIKSAVTGKYDPVVEQLVGKEATGQVVREQGKGRMISGLTIDLEARKRVKLYGRMIAGALSSRDDEVMGKQESVAEMQVVLKIEQTLGNCPKYLNKRRIEPAASKPQLLSDSAQLPQQALDLLTEADIFFVSSANKDEDMDTNHRGGPSGFLRVQSNEASGAVLCWPEYSGNRLYQTLGNLAVYPRAGLCIPDFDTGDGLYITGTTEILVGAEAAALLPRSNLCVRLTVTSARFVTQALPFRGIAGEKSPYNPQVRYLAIEKQASLPQQERELQQATLLSQTKLTPTISRFRFSLQNAATYKPGQYVTLDLSSHMDIGYQHMRDDDPRSLNDDFVRTFTVSSPPGNSPDPVRRLKDDEFEITMRKVGAVTEFLFKHGGYDQRSTLEVGVKGFGGEFEVQQKENESIAFVAAGVGITPILSSLSALDVSRLKLLWSVRSEDLPLVADVVEQHPKVVESLELFVTNAKEGDEIISLLKGKGARVNLRRMEKDDVQLGEDVARYYLCTAAPMRQQVLEWLPGKEFIFEDFNF